MTYTKQQCKEDMIKIWGELARRGCWKWDLDLKDLELHADAVKLGIFYFSCPCCLFTGHRTGARGCKKCPIDWEVGLLPGYPWCNCYNTLFNFWSFATSTQERQYYANRILIKALMIRVTP